MMKKTDPKDATVLVIDSGMFLPFALRLARDFGRVLYWNPIQQASPRVQESQIGEGFDELGVLGEPWDEFSDVDVFAFPDCILPQLQGYLKSVGKPVWGADNAIFLEWERGIFRNRMRDLNLPVHPYHVAHGLSALTYFLKDKKDQYVRISRYRGNGETWHWIDAELSGSRLDELAIEYGPIQEDIDFLVESAFDAKEVGYDGWFYGGRFPSSAFHGIERKDCYDEQTEVLTDEGWKLFKNLSGSEDVLTLNMGDGRHYKLEYQKPTHYIRDWYCGQMLSIETSACSLLVTPNHKLLIQVNSQRDSGPTVYWKNCKGAVQSFRQGKRNRRLVEAKSIDWSKNQLMTWPSSGLFQGRNGHKRPKFKFGEVNIKVSDFASFLGIYLSEGWTNGKRIVIGQKKYTSEMEGVLVSCGLRFSKSLNASTGMTAFEVSNRPLAQYLLQFGKSLDKHVPNWLKNSGWLVIRSFLHWYAMGDGSFLKTAKSTRGKKTPRTSRKFFTISNQMADDLQELLAKCGKQSSKRIAETGVRKNDLYVVSERSVNRKNSIAKNSTRWIDYNGEIFCVTVPNHIILVRRNGKITWSGNSSYFGALCDYTDLPKPLKTVTDAIWPLLARLDYANNFHAEVRVTPDGTPYFTDPTCRHASPAGEPLLEACTNLGEIVLAGSQGEYVEPEWEAKFVAQVLIDHKDDGKEHWRTVRVPDLRWIKLYNACKVGEDLYGIPPLMNSCSVIGSVLGQGDTPEEAVESLKEHAALLDGQDVTVDTASLASAIAESVSEEPGSVEMGGQDAEEAIELAHGED